MVKQAWLGDFGSETSRGLGCVRQEAAEAVDPVAFAREKLGFDPDEKQMAMLRGGKRGILNCSRQWGKSTVAAADGDLWMMSTPNGKRGFLYEEWAHGGPAWERILATGPDCSRLEKRFLEEERGKSERHYRQEYLCEFVEREGAAFSQESIDKAFPDFEPMKI